MSGAESRGSALTPGAPDGDARVDRISSGAALAMLERLSESDLLGAGAVNLIGLEAIRAKLADRWEAKRSRVWEHVEREVVRTVGPAGLFVRVDDITYLIALPGLSGIAAQATCLTVLQDVLRFFLGELKGADLRVRSVTSIEGDELQSAPVDITRLTPAAVAAAAMVEAAASAAKTPPPPTKPSAADPMAVASPIGGLADPVTPAAADWKPPLAGRWKMVPLRPPQQTPFDLRISVEPVWNLRRGLITSFLIERIGAAPEAAAAVHEEVDAAVFAYATSLLHEHTHQGGALTLHVPVQFTSLATQRTRLRLLSLTQAVRDAMRQTVLFEICGLDSGVPPSRLIEVIGLVRSLCAGVLGRVRPSKAALQAVRGCGLRGLAIEAPLLSPQTLDGDVRMKAFVSAAQSICPNLVLHGLPTGHMVDAAAAAGFTHASAPAETSGSA